MSILINLLPDLRQAKLRERRRRQLVSGVSVLVWAVCGGLVVLLVLFTTGQTLAINALTGDIKKNTDTLKGMDDLPAALTAADHLAALPGLYGKRTYFTHFLSAYEAADPTDVTLTSITVDNTNTLLVLGTGKSYASAAKLARAVEAFNVKVGPEAKADNTPYFTNVQLKNVSQDNAGVAFSLNATVGSGAVSNGK
jgi:Tfp pilus assembly protein PilN